MTRRMQVVYDVPCPYCHAGVDEPCKTVPRPPYEHYASHKIATYHEARRMAFRIAKASEPARE